MKWAIPPCIRPTVWPTAAARITRRPMVITPMQRLITGARRFRWASTVVGAVGTAIGLGQVALAGAMVVHPEWGGAVAADGVAVTVGAAADVDGDSASLSAMMCT